MYSGFFINRFGYKKAFIVSLFFHTIASFGYLFLFQGPVIFTAITINILRSLRGIGKELIKTTSSAYFRHLSENHLHPHYLLGGKDFLKGIGLLGGSILLFYLGFHLSFGFLGILTFLCLILAKGVLKDHKEIKQISFSGFFKVNHNLMILAIIRASLYAGRDLWLVIPIPIYLQSIGMSKIMIGTVLACGLMVFGTVQPLAGFFVKSRLYIRSFVIKSKWYYEDIIAVSSFFLLLVPLGMYFLKTNFLAVFLLVITYNIFAGLATAPHNYLHLRLANKERASIDIAFYKTISQFGKVIAVFSSGFLYDSYGISGCLLASIGCLFVSGILGAILSNKVHRDKIKKIKDMSLSK